MKKILLTILLILPTLNAVDEDDIENFFNPKPNPVSKVTRADKSYPMELRLRVIQIMKAYYEKHPSAPGKIEPFNSYKQYPHKQYRTMPINFCLWRLELNSDYSSEDLEEIRDQKTASEEVLVMCKFLEYYLPQDTLI